MNREAAHRLASLAVVLLYVGAAWRGADFVVALRLFAALLLPLLVVWFPDVAGQLSNASLMRMSAPTPPGLARFGGWLILTLPLWGAAVVRCSTA